MSRSPCHLRLDISRRRRRRAKLLVTGLVAANIDNVYSVAGLDDVAKTAPVKWSEGDPLGCDSTAFSMAQAINSAADSNQNPNTPDIINISGQIALVPQACRRLRTGSGRLEVTASLSRVAGGNGGNYDNCTDTSGDWFQTDDWSPGLLDDVISMTPQGLLTTDAHVLDGTSLAAPLVAGAVALLLSLDQRLSQAEVLRILKVSSGDQIGTRGDDTGFDNYDGHRRLDVGAAVDFVLELEEGFESGDSSAWQ